MGMRNEWTGNKNQSVYYTTGRHGGTELGSDAAIGARQDSVLDNRPVVSVVVNPDNWRVWQRQESFSIRNWEWA
jgi:hypothetical protein